MKRVIGLCGGSGAGKSTVAEILKSADAELIDADRISREISAPGGEAYDRLRMTFPDFFNEAGILDRRALGSLVFVNPVAMADLEAILHPVMRRVIQERIDASDAEQVVLDCAIVTKPVFRDLVDEVWVVTAPAEERVRRIVQRDEVSEEAARRRLGAQAREEELLAMADRVIRNDGSVDALRAQMEV